MVASRKTNIHPLNREYWSFYFLKIRGMITTHNCFLNGAKRKD